MTEAEVRRIEQMLVDLKERLLDGETGELPLIRNSLRIYISQTEQNCKDIAILQTKVDWMPSRNRLLTTGVSAIILIGGLIFALFKAFTQRGN